MRTKIIALTSVLALACAPLSPAHADNGYVPTNVTPGLTATIEPPLPRGAAWYDAPSLPAWATIAPDGTIRLAPGEDVTPGSYEWPVTATFADDSTQTFPVSVTVGADNDASDEGAVIDAFVQYAPEVSHRCAATALGVGLPLLVLLPLGFASQMSFPFVARQNHLQLQVGNVPFLVDVKLRDLNSRDVDMGIAGILAAAGLAGAGAIISQCQ